MVKTLISTGSVCQNRKARFRYTVLETVEAGIILTGAEVKSLRAGRADISQSYAAEKDGKLCLINAQILDYASSGTVVRHIVGRPRPLLLHKKEQTRLLSSVAQKGTTLVPLEIYFNNRGLAKVKLGLAQGKNQKDKRETIKQRDWDKQKRRMLTAYNKQA